MAKLLLMLFVYLLCCGYVGQISYAQIFRISCEIQASEAFKWTTEAAQMMSLLGVGGISALTIVHPPRAGLSIGLSAIALVRYLWPMLTGFNENCTFEAMAKMQAAMAATTKQQLNNYTLGEIKAWYDGQAETSEKVHEWAKLIDTASDEATRRNAALQMLRGLKFLYFSANEARNTFIDNSPTSAPATFILVRDLALLQLGIATEIIANNYTSPVVRRKFLQDYQADVMFYWEQSHVAVERLVSCLPSKNIGSARLQLLGHLDPLLQFAYKIIANDTKANYTKQAVYKTIQNDDFVAFRFENGSLFSQQQQQQQTTCPKCGWPLFAHVNGELWEQCRSSIFKISKNVESQTVQSCDHIKLSTVGDGQRPSEMDELIGHSVYSIVGLNETTNQPLPCGMPIFDRDHVQLTSIAMPPGTSGNVAKLNALDLVILHAD